MYHLTVIQPSTSHNSNMCHQINQISWFILDIYPMGQGHCWRSQGKVPMDCFYGTCRSNKWWDIPISIFNMTIIEKWTLAHKSDKIRESRSVTVGFDLRWACTKLEGHSWANKKVASYCTNVKSFWLLVTKHTNGRTNGQTDERKEGHQTEPKGHSWPNKITIK